MNSNTEKVVLVITVEVTNTTADEAKEHVEWLVDNEGLQEMFEINLKTESTITGITYMAGEGS